MQFGVDRRHLAGPVARDIELVEIAKSSSDFSGTNGDPSFSRRGVRCADISSMASTCRQDVSYPMPTVTCRIRPWVAASGWQLTTGLPRMRDWGITTFSCFNERAWVGGSRTSVTSTRTCPL